MDVVLFTCGLLWSHQFVTQKFRKERDSYKESGREIEIKRWRGWEEAGI